MSDDLDPAELAEVTGRKLPKAQAKRLAEMGVPFEFLGRAVRVRRLVAQAFALLPERAPAGIDLSRVKR